MLTFSILNQSYFTIEETFRKITELMGGLFFDIFCPNVILYGPKF